MQDAGGEKKEKLQRKCNFEDMGFVFSTKTVETFSLFLSINTLSYCVSFE